MVQGAEKLTQAKQNADIADSLSYYIDMAASYTGILTNQTTYEEIRQTGKTSLIQDDTMKKSILGHYTTLIPCVKEWYEVDKTHTMTQLIPEMSNYFPAIIDTVNIVPEDQKIKYLQTPKLKHLLITNLTYKKEAIEMANANTKRLIARIDRVLKNSLYLALFLLFICKKRSKLIYLSIRNSITVDHVYTQNTLVINHCFFDKRLCQCLP